MFSLHRCCVTTRSDRSPWPNWKISASRFSARVAEHLNFRKAAEHLFLTQPAITLQIKALEDDLGVRLFDRSANRVTLTPQGSVLLRYARKIAQLASRSRTGTRGGRRTILGRTLPRRVHDDRAIRVAPADRCFLGEHPRVQLATAQRQHRGSRTALARGQRFHRTHRRTRARARRSHRAFHARRIGSDRAAGFRR